MFGLRKAIETLSTMLGSVSQERDELRARLDQSERQAADLRVECATLQAQVSATQHELDLALEANAALSHAMESIR